MKILYRFFALFLSFSLVSGGYPINADPPESDMLGPGDKITISMDFKDASLKDILKLFSMQSGLNFIASQNVEDRKVTLYMDKVPLEYAMDKLFKANNLTYELDRNARIFLVKDLGKPQAEVVTRVFYLKYASVSTSSLLSELGTQLGGTGSSSSSSSESEESSGTTTTEGRWKTAEESGITSVVKRLLSKDGIVIEDYRTNSLIVMDSPTKMDVIATTIAAIDVAAPQVMLEVEMLDVSKNLVDKLGFKYGQTPLTLNLAGATRFTKFPFGGLIPGGSQVSKAASDVPGHFEAGSVSVNSSGYQIILDFLKTQTDTKYLARPRILTLNNETAEIKIATQETIGVQTQVVTGGSTSETTTPERMETGVRLRVTPQINMETGEVTMFVVPTVKDTSTSTFLVSGSTSTYFKDPEERTTKSVIRVKDGETVILGGLIRNEATEIITKVPLLGDVPILGSLFRHKNRDKGKERELLVFITPRIIKEGNARLAQNAISFADREQGTVSGFDRSSAIGTSLDNFESAIKR